MGVAEVVGIATAVVLALCGALAKVWHDLRDERRSNDELTERLNKEHKRDLRWQLGMPTSLDPGPKSSPVPPAFEIVDSSKQQLVRDEPARPPRPGKKLRK